MNWLNHEFDHMTVLAWIALTELFILTLIGAHWLANKFDKIQKREDEYQKEMEQEELDKERTPDLKLSVRMGRLGDGVTFSNLCVMDSPEEAKKSMHLYCDTWVDEFVKRFGRRDNV